MSTHYCTLCPRGQGRTCLHTTAPCATGGKVERVYTRTVPCAPVGKVERVYTLLHPVPQGARQSVSTHHCTRSPRGYGIMYRTKHVRMMCLHHLHMPFYTQHGRMMCLHHLHMSFYTQHVCMVCLHHLHMPFHTQHGRMM